MNITYLQAGEYLVPNLTTPEQPELNRYGHMRWKYLKEQEPNRYTALLMSGQLTPHLQKVGEETELQVKARMAQLLNSRPAPETGSLERGQYMDLLRMEAEAEILPKTVYL